MTKNMSNQEMADLLVQVDALVHAVMRQRISNDTVRDRLHAILYVARQIGYENCLRNTQVLVAQHLKEGG
jgi:hypothetical protein